jgi:hypothetical protein
MQSGFSAQIPGTVHRMHADAYFADGETFLHSRVVEP